MCAIIPPMGFLRLHSDTEDQIAVSLERVNDFAARQLPESALAFQSAMTATEWAAKEIRTEVADLGAYAQQLHRELSWALWTLVAMSAAVTAVEIWRTLRE
jgi:hypothetical protein